jgi:hemolysin D
VVAKDVVAKDVVAKDAAGKGTKGNDQPGDARMAELPFLPDPDAIERRPLGGVTRGVLIGLSLMLASALLWASVSMLDEIVFARGRLISSQPNLLVQPIDSSMVQTIDVRVGQVVKKGQKLASLDPTFVGADESALKGTVAKLEARERRLERELVGGLASASGNDSRDVKLQADLRAAKEANYQSRMQSLAENIARLEASLRTNRADQRAQQERVKVATDLEQMQKDLVTQNFGAKKQLLEARDRRQEVERELLLTRNREQELLREIESVKAEQKAFQNEWRQRALEELAETRRERETASEQLAKASKRASLISLVAPADAIVLEVAKRPVGSVVREGEVLFTLVPIDVPMEVELQIGSSDVGFVKPGDSVRMKLDAFPFQKYGTLTGKITVVSQDAFSPESMPLDGRRAQGDYYLARVSLVSEKLEKNPDNAIVRPGSTLSGEIKVGQRSVLSYFLYPIIRTFDESMRERR